MPQQLLVYAKGTHKSFISDILKDLDAELLYFKNTAEIVASNTNGQIAIIQDSLWNKTLAKTLNSRNYPPIVICFGSNFEDRAEARYGDLHYIPFNLDQNNPKLSIVGSLEQLAKFKRILALKEHRMRGWNFEKNPVLYLITNLVRECSLASSNEHVLKALNSLRSVLDFQFSAIYFFDHQEKFESAIFEGLKSISKKSYNRKDWPSSTNWNEIFKESNCSILSPFDTTTRDITPFHEPWSSALSLRVVPKQSESGRRERTAIITLFRNQLVPFSDHDSLLLEISNGPLTLALEKAEMIENLVQASHKWRSTFDSISEPVIVINGSYEIVKANKNFSKTLEIDFKTVKGRKCYSLFANRKQPCAGCPTQSPLDIDFHKVPNRAGQEYLSWSYRVNVNKQKYNFMFYRSLEKETQLRSTFVQSEKMAALGKLIGSVAHEINNPLAGILSTCQVSLSSENKDYSEELEEIRSAALRAKKIIDNLLGFTNSRIEEESFDFKELVLNTISLCKSAIKKTKVNLVIRDQLPKVKTNQAMLQQILFNLITNGLQALNGEGDLLISVKSVSGEIECLIKDNGPGIEAKKLKNIFDPFYSTKPEGSGTGLGLSIVGNLAKKLQIRIDVSSQLGKGTEFKLRIPV